MGKDGREKKKGGNGKSGEGVSVLKMHLCTSQILIKMLLKNPVSVAASFPEAEL